MNTPARQPPRFVPTLTEMVDPHDAQRSTAKPDPAADLLVQEVWQKLQPLLAQRVQEESEQWLRATLAQHLRELNARTQSALESLVRQAVLDALKTQNRANPDAAPRDI